MKKEYTYCVLSICVLLLAIVFTISAVLLETLPFSSKSALLLFSLCFIVVGTSTLAVHYKKYLRIKHLLNHDAPILAHWVYDTDSYPLLKNALIEQKCSTISTAILSVILALIFFTVFAYSGGVYILYLGYGLNLLSVLVFVAGLYFINTYYKTALSSTSEAIFSEEYIYFLDELHTNQKSIYFLEKVIIDTEVEPVFKLIYGQYDIDDVPIYEVSIPIPKGKEGIAEYLRKYYMELIDSN